MHSLPLADCVRVSVCFNQNIFSTFGCAWIYSPALSRRLSIRGGEYVVASYGLLTHRCVDVNRVVYRERRRIWTRGLRSVRWLTKSAVGRRLTTTATTNSSSGSTTTTTSSNWLTNSERL